MMLNRFLFACTLFLFMLSGVCAQQKDSLQQVIDSTKITDTTTAVDSTQPAPLPKSTDSVAAVLKVSKASQLDSILNANIYLNIKGKPVSFIQSLRKADSKNISFYALAFLVLVFALLKFLYPRYFTNLFRVFFNTSLRQSQLTDQLLQAKLPSLLFNIFFILIGSGYLYLLLEYYGKSASMYSKWQIFALAAGGLTAIYLAKYSILKFTGWVTGYKQEVDTYIFIIFLINKIVAVCLIPLVIVIAFSDRQLVDIALLVSFIMITAMILMRFFRSYGLLQNKLKVSRFHFFIYIIGIEILPLLVIYKLAMIFMSKNL
jgi:hypothetical protein